MAAEPAALKPKFKQPIKRARGDVVAADDPTPDEQNAAEQLKRTVLENTVNNRIRESMMARQNSGIEEIWADSDDLYNGVDALYNPVAMVKTRDKAPRKGAGNARAKVVLNITKPKTDSAVARVQEMLVPNDEKPWGISSTPIPEFDEAMQSGTGEQVTLADGTAAPAALVAAMAKDKADEATKEEEKWIEDRFVEGDVYPMMRQVIKDAGRIGTGVLMGPIPIERTDRKWRMQGNVALLEIIKHIEPTSKCVRAQDCFPDPACGDDIHRGAYFCYRDHVTTRGLRELAPLPGYDREAIGQAIMEGPSIAPIARQETNRRNQPGDAVAESALFQLFYYYGDMSPEDLILLGYPADKLDDTDLALAAIPSIVTTLNGRIIKATIAPQETGRFPFDFFPWDAVESQPFGRGIPWKMAVAQRGCTASVRAMNENAGLCGGPLIAFIKGALTPIDGIYDVHARKMFEFEPSELVDDIRKAFATFNIESHQKEFLELVQFWLNMADQLTNLPMLLQGEQAAGTSPETLGGMKMLVSNATSPLRVIAKQYDDRLIKPHLRGYHDWFMEKVDDPKIAPNKRFCDTQIEARGSTVLVQREEAREFLMQLFAVKDDPDLRIDPSKFATEVARANGFNMRTIQYSDDDWKKKQDELAKNPPPGDPRIEAANIRNQGLQAQNDANAKNAEADRAFKAQQADLDRKIQQFVSDTEKQIEEMRLAADQNVSLEDIKAMLAGKAMDLRMQRDKMQADMMSPHQGI